MRITSKGQVTIPQAIRNKYGFMPETDLEFVERDGFVALQRADASKPDRAQQFIDRLAGTGTGSLTTDEVMELTRGYSADG
jgi:AbrB family looped-hinge helix DNA binding protein